MRRSLLAVSVVVFVAGVPASLAGGGSVSAGSSAAPPAGQIIFTADDPIKGVGTSLYVTSSDGKQAVRRLITDGGEPAAARDGSMLAFVRGGAIWVMRRDGSGARRLTHPKAASKNDPNTGEWDGSPAWSPDKKVVYFDRTDPAKIMTSIYSVRADGTGLRQLTHPGSENCDWGAAPSPDGRVVAFSSAQNCMRTGFPSIVAITPAGRPAPLRFRWAGAEQSWPAWSPDGRTILYTVEDFDGEKGFRCVGLYLSTTSSAPRRLARGGCDAGYAWSPDGTWLAVSGMPITLIREDGTRRQALAATARWSATSVVWLPAAERRAG